MFNTLYLETIKIYNIKNFTTYHSHYELLANFITNNVYTFYNILDCFETPYISLILIKLKITKINNKKI